MTKCPHCSPKVGKRTKRKAFMPIAPVNAERDAEIARLYIMGDLTTAQIGERYGIDASRVSQICKKQRVGIQSANRIALWNRRHKGTTGRFAGLINSENNASDRLPNGDGAPRSHPFNHEQTNSAGRV